MIPVFSVNNLKLLFEAKTNLKAQSKSTRANPHQDYIATWCICIKCTVFKVCTQSIRVVLQECLLSSKATLPVFHGKPHQKRFSGYKFISIQNSKVILDYVLFDSENSWSSERLVVYEIFMTLRRQNILGHNFVQESRNYLPNLRILKIIHKMRNCFREYDVVVQNNKASV